MSSYPAAAAAAAPSAGPSSSRSRKSKSGKRKLETGSYTLGGGPAGQTDAFEAKTAAGASSRSSGRRVKGLPARSGASGSGGGGRAGPSSQQTTAQQKQAEKDWILRVAPSVAGLSSFPGSRS